MSDRFGPHEEDFDAGRDYFGARGFVISEETTNRMTMLVTSTRAAIEGALDVEIGDFNIGLKGTSNNCLKIKQLQSSTTFGRTL